MTRLGSIIDGRPSVFGHRRAAAERDRRRGSRSAWSLVEIMVVLIIMGILISMAAPSFRRALEQSRADIAGANLRSIWSAQRIYWLDHHAYAANLGDLTSIGLIDPTVTAAATVYVYAIPAAETNAFVATATRTGSERWTGDFTIDESGVVSGVVQASGEADLTPGFQ